MTRRACACDDFGRSHAIAGDGLPAVERGMPAPAGTGLTRRSFLSKSLGVALTVYGLDRLTLLDVDGGIAEAATASNRVLVSVFLDGGADSLSMLFPAADALYYQYRPTLALPQAAGVPFAEDGRLRWHPSLASLAQLHVEGKVSVIPAIGYTSPDKSHFTSRHYWEVGATNAGLATGWLGRYLDHVGTRDNPLQGLSLDNRLQPALATGKVPVASIDGPDRYKFAAPRRAETTLESRILEAVGELGAAHAPSRDRAIREVAAAASQSHRLRRELQGLGPDVGHVPPAYPQSPDEFPRRLAGLAAMLAAGMPIRCAALKAPGMYDTHADQADELNQALKLTADSLLAFQRDLEARGLADRVLVHVWSEFGRRARENGSDGTDHGAAGLGLVIGTRAAGRMVGEFPGLGGLDEQGNLRATADFRGVYSAILEQWLDADAAAIIPNAGAFPRPALVR